MCNAHLHICIYIYIHIHIFTYIYMYISDLSTVDPPNKVVQEELETKNKNFAKRVRSENCLWSRCWRTRRLIRCVGLQPRYLGFPNWDWYILRRAFVLWKTGFLDRNNRLFPSASIFLMRGAYNSQAGFCDKSKKLSLGKKKRTKYEQLQKKNLPNPEGEYDKIPTFQNKLFDWNTVDGSEILLTS